MGKVFGPDSVESARDDGGNAPTRARFGMSCVAARLERLHRPPEREHPLRVEEDVEAAVEASAEELQAVPDATLATERERVREHRGEDSLDRVAVDRVGGRRGRELPPPADRQPA